LAIQGETEKSSPDDEAIGQLMNPSHTNETRTNKMPPFLHNPGSWAVKAVIITRGEVDDGEEERISRPDMLSRGNAAS
jgi:hypothetical protein